MTERTRNDRVPETLQELARNLALVGDHDALVSFKGSEIHKHSFGELAAEAESRARALVHRGVGAGDPVILSGPGGPDWIVMCMAVLRCGACVVPVDTQLPVETFRHILEDSGARLALVSSSAAKRFDAPLADRGITVLPIADAGDAGDAGDAAGGEEIAFPSVKPGDRAILFYTSGTTGPPKGVPLTHRNITFQIDVIARSDLVTTSDRLLLPLPLHHVYPLVIGVFTPLALGLALVLPDGFTGPRILMALREGGATMMIGVPRLYEALVTGVKDRMKRSGRPAAALFGVFLALSRMLRRRFSWRVGKGLFAPLHRRFGPTLHTVISGGAALRPETAWTLEALGWQVATGYGLTETSPLLTINPPGEMRFETAGRPVEGVALSIDQVSGEGNLGGEVLARGPGVFAGYHKLPDKTAEAFTDEGWFRTGDLGWMDDEGWLRLAGRKSTMIVTEGGENVQPDQIEDAYQDHPSIAEIAVFEHQGRIVGLIVPDPSARRGGEVEQAVRAAVREISAKLPSYRRLNDYRLSGEAIPRTRLGKVRRHLIADRYERAGKGDEDKADGAAEPVAIDELSFEDQALLEDEVAYMAFKLLVDRFPGRRVTPDSDLQLDLGVDSIGWLDLAFEISEHTGVTLSESAIAEIRSVRDLLARLAQGDESGNALKAPLEDPEGALDDRQRRWLEPQGAVLRTVGGLLAALNRGAMRMLFRLKVHGLENIPAEGPVVFAPNHASYLDPFLLAGALQTRHLERTYWAGWTGVVFNSPLRRAFARVARVVPIDPDRSTASSLAFGGVVLKRGLNLVWFPEGARSRDGRLQPFRQGIGLLLDRRRVPVVPVIIHGTHEAWPVSRRFPRLRPTRIAFLEPVNADALADEGKGDTDAKRIVDALQERIHKAFPDR